MAIGLQVAELRAELDTDALAGRTVKLRVDHVILRLGATALPKLIPPGKGITIEGVRSGAIFLQVVKGAIRAEVELRPEVGPTGRLRLTLASVRANGVPLPNLLVGIVIGFFRAQAEGFPGIHLAPGNIIEADLGEILARTGVQLAPLRAVRVTNEAVELEYLRAGSAPA